MKLIPVLSILLFSSGLQAGNPDSLRQVLAKQQGVNRLPVLLQLCEIENRTLLTNAESTLYSEELVQIASAKRDTTAWIEGCLCAAAKQDRTAGKATTEIWLIKAEQLAKHRPKAMARVLFWKGNFILESGQVDSALLIFQTGLKLFTRHRLPSLDHIKLIGTTAKLYSRRNEARLADSLGRRAIQLCTNPADSAEALRYWAGIQEDLGRPDEAIGAYLGAYQIEKKSGSTVAAAYNLRQAASILRNQGHYEQAIRYFNESIALSEGIGYSLGLASAWHSLAGLYKGTGEYKQALHYYKLALSLKKDLGRPKKILTTIRDMADLYYLTNQYDSCLALCTNHLPVSKELKLYESESHLAFLAAMSAAKMGKDKLARTYLSQGEVAVLLISTPEERPTILKLAAQSHALLGQYENAYYYQVESQNAQDSIFNAEKSRIVSEMETRFDTERKEKQIIDLAEQNELNQARIVVARTRQLGLLIGLGLFVALAFVLYRNAVARKRHNATLEKTNLELTRKNHEVQTLLREIHHRVKNNLQIISSLLKLQARKISDESTLEALRTGQARVRSMALLHQRLYQGDELKDIPMKAYLADLTQSLLDAYQVDENRILLRTDLDDVLLDVDAAVPLGLIVNELITNSLKYAFPDDRSGEIELTLKQKGADLYLQLSDNGIGMQLDSGQPVVQKSSFGLELVASLTQKLNGQLSFFNGIGSRTELVVPKFSTKELMP